MKNIYTFLAACLLLASSSGRAAVRYETTSDWTSGFNGRIVITNDTGAALSNWTLEFDFASTIDLIWDARIASRNGTHYTIQPAAWNARIAAGSSVSFGFGGKPGGIKAGPQNFNLNGTAAQPAPPPPPPPPPPPEPAPAGGIQVSVAQTANWSGGFTANLEILNAGSQAIDGWSLKFRFAPGITSLWNGTLAQSNGVYTVVNAGWNGAIAPGAKATLGFTGNGALASDSASECSLNGAACSISVSTASPASPGAPGAANSIVIDGVDDAGEALLITIPRGAAQYGLSLRNPGTAIFAVTTSNPAVAQAQIASGALRITGIAPGRASLKIQETAGGLVRFVGVRVKNDDGSSPGMPGYLSIGSVSEDTTDHLTFLQSFQPGPLNKRVDVRYIYLNGGPVNGWDTWGNEPGSRATNYIRNSRKLGIIPFFVFYNIPDGGESYWTDMQHVQDAAYLGAYFKNLKLTLDIINRESPGDLVGIILEPDFLGYLAQNAGQPASSIAAATSAVYDSGVLPRAGSPDFANTVQGLVEAINYVISRYSPQVYFGWQVNLWASPAGGWVTTVPGRGLMHKTEEVGVATGRPLIYQEAAAITNYYLQAGTASYGARFLSIDKYGLDATGFEASAASDPSGSTWFWNNDLWQNYLTFVRAMHQTSKLPVILWQLPVGHINGTKEVSPYAASGVFPNLTNNNRMLEDSTGTFFFGDSFTAAGSRATYFAANQGNDPALRVSGTTITWGAHMADTAAAGVVSVLFGAGVGASTTNVGTPPSDAYWWITKAQKYLASPAPLQVAP